MNKSSFVAIDEMVGLGALEWSVALWEWDDRVDGFSCSVDERTHHTSLEEAQTAAKARAKTEGVRYLGVEEEHGLLHPSEHCESCHKGPDECTCTNWSEVKVCPGCKQSRANCYC